MLRLSCFGHVRAKNNSAVWLDLSCVSPLDWDLFLVVLPSSQVYEGLFGCWYAVVVPWMVLAWPLVEGLLNPAVFGLAVLCPLGYV